MISLASHLVLSVYLLPSKTGFIGGLPCLCSIYVGPRHLNSSPHACVASTLASEPSSQRPNYFLSRIYCILWTGFHQTHRSPIRSQDNASWAIFRTCDNRYDPFNSQSYLGMEHAPSGPDLWENGKDQLPVSNCSRGTVVPPSPWWVGFNNLRGYQTPRMLKPLVWNGITRLAYDLPASSSK